MSKIPDLLLKPYNPKATEERVYKLWEKSGFFNPDNLPPRHKTPFSIVLPPPNVTGTLHIGHAAMLAIEDIIIRFERMRGKKTLWLPGTDHAAIATQERVEKDLYRKEKKTRHDLGREKFLKQVEKFAKESHDTITTQVKRMGSSVDWSREAYTLDEPRNIAVKTAFKRMYDDGLIYRGHRIVNWDPKLQTTVSDDEVEYVEQKDPFYHFKYGPFEIATVRPETKFGDKYVVMHPNDIRYKKYKHGDTFELEWINGPITATIIKDEAADMEFGSGAMTITPAHSGLDFEIAKRHNLDIEPVIDERGLLLPIAGEFTGTHIKKARAAIVEKLQKKGLVTKIDENYTHNVATNSRGGGVIEPQIKLQWFVDVNKEFKLPHSELKGVKTGQTTTLKKLMSHAVESGQIEIIPERFSKIYYHWIDNLRDWCISRQIWYGHRIPAWRKGISQDSLLTQTRLARDIPENIYVGIEAPEDDGWEQDPDTLDTWFSSGLWTFSTLGWPRKTKDLETYHPTDILETGYDILFFWVARMILMSIYLIGQIPFKKVYLHGLVRDGQGRKMSKSLGNIIDPVDMVDKYGADAVRLALIIGTAPGNDSKLSEDKIRGYKHFANKIWNAARFVISNLEDFEVGSKYKPTKSDTDELKNFDLFKKRITDYLENYKFYLAGEELYHYFWHSFADRTIEEHKDILYGKDGKGQEARASAQGLLYTLLSEQLKLLHPFMPFVTEEVWSMLPKPRRKVGVPTEASGLLMIETWPK